MEVRMWGLEKSKVFDGFSGKRGFRQGTTRFSRHHYYRINTLRDLCRNLSRKITNDNVRYILYMVK